MNELSIPLLSDEKKAYLLGLRAGDIYARKDSNRVIVEVTSSKPVQIEMFQNVFSSYGKVSWYEKKGGATEKTTRAYCSLNSSFEFLVNKPTYIPEWILNKEELFYSFLAGYVDSEGSWIITKHKKYNGKYKDLVFSLGTCDKTILEQIHKKLKELGFKSHFYLVRKRGTYTGIGVCNFDLYRVMLMRIKDVIRLAKILLPLSKHKEKQNKIQKIIELESFFKRASSIEIPCPYCGYEKIWKCGFWKYKDKKYPRYICPNCGKYISKKKVELVEEELNANHRSFLSRFV
ncbi:MAG: LAGLIDADG family homing endonuclease [Candidatus Aenigmatarchaeota archaeon]